MWRAPARAELDVTMGVVPGSHIDGAVNEANERIAVRKLLTLSLTFDHRLVDGAPAARFLQHVKNFVEHPTTWLIR